MTALSTLFDKLRSHGEPDRMGEITRLLSMTGPGTPLSVLEKRRPNWHRNLMVGMASYAVGKEAYSIVRRLRGERDLGLYIIVDETDYLFPVLIRWLLQHMPVENRQGLLAVTTREWVGERQVISTDYVLDGNRAETVTIDGHEISIELSDKPDKGSSVSGGDDADSIPEAAKGYTYIRRRLIFKCDDEEARDAVKRLIASLADTETKSREPRFFTTSRWGGWSSNSAAMKRSLESVVLRDGVRELLVDDLHTFLDQEAEYAHWSLPWHRGYLLYGPPGTGKTSICAALATHFGMDVYYLSFSNVKNDAELLGLMREIGPRSILVIEDIDVLHASHSRELRDENAEDQGVTLAGLINALDGLVTPHGMVTIMTTNKFHVLDEALTRDGRVDVKVEVEPLDDDQLRRLCEHFVGSSEGVPSLGGLELTAADALGQLKKHFGDPDAARRALITHIESLRAQRS